MTISWSRRVVPLWGRSTEPQIRFVKQHAFTTNNYDADIALDSHELASAIEDFQSSPSIGVAADLLRFGLRGVSRPELIDAAKFIMSADPEVPTGLARLAKSVLQGDPTLLALHGEVDQTKSCSNQIHDLRRWLVRYPRDSMTWLDIGRLHASSGNLLGASRAVRTAHGLAPNSRSVLRSTSRFYLHAREPEQALHVLDAALRTAGDPWLMAGHIAISSILRKKSKFIKKARQLVEAGGVRPRELTELASALASLELEAGSIRSARKLFNVALQDPNENSLAQAEWAVSQLNIEPSLPLNWLEGPEAAEASYYRDLAVGDFSAALKDAVRWHDDEPFASRPMLGASFIAGVVGKFEEASSFARQGLLTEPTNIALLNNLAFSTGAQGNIAGAEKIVRKIVSLEQRELSGHTIANLGMLAYLRGELILADSLYEEAMTNFRRAKRFEEVAIAGAYKVVFARRANAEDLEKAVSKARELAENSKSNLAISLFKLLLASPIENTAPESIAVPPRKWHYDSSKNILTFDPPKPLG